MDPSPAGEREIYLDAAGVGVTCANIGHRLDLSRHSCQPPLIPRIQLPQGSPAATAFHQPLE